MWDKIKEMLGIEGASEMAHPALKNVSPLAESAKHVGKSTIKGAIKGALIATAVVMGITLLGGAGILTAVGAAATAIPVVGWVAGPVMMALGAVAGTGLGGWAGVALAGSAAMFGAKIGGLIGAAKGVASADEAVATAEENAMISYDRATQRARSEMIFNAKMAARGAGAPLAPSQVPNMGLGEQVQR